MKCEQCENEGIKEFEGDILCKKCYDDTFKIMEAMWNFTNRRAKKLGKDVTEISFTDEDIWVEIDGKTK